MKEAVLIIIKPDGITKFLTGYVLTRFVETNLEIIGSRVIRVSRSLAEEHYKHLRKKIFYEEVLSYTLGNFHEKKYVIAFVLWGDQSIKKCRKLAGATNPEDAVSNSIRGSCGRITTKGVFENVLHVSSDSREAEREIKLWFTPDDLILDIFSSKLKKIKNFSKRIWIND